MCCHQLPTRRTFSGKVLTGPTQMLQILVWLKKEPKNEDYTVKKNHMKRILKHGSINSRCKEINWRSCSILLNVVKTVYSYRELVGKNFLEERTGPLSPRRVHLIGYHYLDFCGDNMDEFTKAVNAINSGIRAISRKWLSTI